ncbi:hypothetical protein FJQ64_14680 [Lysinibacillus sp. BW-2-10]|nr:hypothetical protein FJQ64_14680 [Lysinibacillus sp. BW-2-10]
MYSFVVWPFTPSYPLNWFQGLLYPALTGSNVSVPKALATGTRRPPQDFSEAKKISGRSTARKSPIGSTNISVGDEENPHGLKFHFILHNTLLMLGFLFLHSLFL